jgi:hypothetical protein
MPHRRTTRKTMMERIVVTAPCKAATMTLRSESGILVIARRLDVILAEGGRRSAMRKSRLARIVIAEDSLVRAMGPNSLVRRYRPRCET